MPLTLAAKDRHRHSKLHSLCADNGAPDNSDNMILHWFSGLLVLKFDGALRPPRDPGFPTKSLSKLATCGAAVWDDHNRLVALGGKRVSLVPGMTSADAEFEGILLGLEWLCEQPGHWWSAMGSGPPSSLTVYGDCKAIIDQLNGDSQPRKLKPKHEIAEKFLEQLRPVVDIRFQHVPRIDNKLCDGICQTVIDVHVSRANNELEKDYLELRNNPLPEGGRRKPQPTPLSECIERHLGEGSLIPLSMRPQALHKFVKVADNIKDGAALVSAGRILEADAKEFPPCSESRRKHPHCKQQLTAVAAELQIRGLDLLNKTKESKRIQHKHRFNLSRYSTDLDAVGLVTPARNFVTHHDSEPLVSWKNKYGMVCKSDEAVWTLDHP